MAKQVTKKRNIGDYYEDALGAIISMKPEIMKLEVSDNAQAAKRLCRKLRDLRSIKKGPMTVLYNKAKMVREEIKQKPKSI